MKSSIKEQNKIPAGNSQARIPPEVERPAGSFSASAPVQQIKTSKTLYFLKHKSVENQNNFPGYASGKTSENKDY